MEESSISSFEALPCDVGLLVCDFIDPQDIGCVACVNRRCHELVKSRLPEARVVHQVPRLKNLFIPFSASDREKIATQCKSFLQEAKTIHGSKQMHYKAAQALPPPKDKSRFNVSWFGRIAMTSTGLAASTLIFSPSFAVYKCLRQWSFAHPKRFWKRYAALITGPWVGVFGFATASVWAERHLQRLRPNRKEGALSQLSIEKLGVWGAAGFMDKEAFEAVWVLKRLTDELSVLPKSEVLPRGASVIQELNSLCDQLYLTHKNQSRP